jgi:hypothetical protein
MCLLSYNCAGLWRTLMFSVFYAWLNIATIDMGNRVDHLYFLSFHGSAYFLFVIPALSFRALLNDRGINSLEFVFTKAIHRASLFCVKSSLYLMICSMPLVIACVHSYGKPTIQIELPQNSIEHREETKQFYLTHYEGAYLQASDTGKNEDYIVLPEGRLNQAVGYFLFGLTAILYIQTFIFAFSGVVQLNRRSFLTLTVFAAFVPVASYWFIPSGFCEAGLGWITQHAFLAFLGVGVIAFLSQKYCCDRFVNIEVIS